VTALIELRRTLQHQLSSLAAHLDQVRQLIGSAPQHLDPPAAETGRVTAEDFPRDSGGRATPSGPGGTAGPAPGGLGGPAGIQPAGPRPVAFSGRSVRAVQGTAEPVGAAAASDPIAGQDAREDLRA